MSNNLKKSKKVNGIKTNTVVLEKNERDLVINDNFINSFVNREVLNDAYEKILKFMFDEEKNGGYIQMATGIGKTKVIAALINWLFQNKKENEHKICLLASHRLMLNEQLLDNIVNVIKFFNEGKKNYAIINCSSDYNIGKGIGKTGDNLINLKPHKASEYIKEHKDQDIFIVTTQTSIDSVVNNLIKNKIRTDLTVLDESHKFTKGGKRKPYLLTINENSKKTIAFSATQNDIVTENFHNIFTFNFCDAAERGYVVNGELAMIKDKQKYDGVNPYKVIVNKKNLPTKVVNGVVEIIKDFHNNGKKIRLLATCGENVKTVEVSAKKLSEELANDPKTKDIPILMAASKTDEINKTAGIVEKIGGCTEWKNGEKVGKLMSQREFLNKVKNLNNDQNAEYIILYAKMLSEGIDIPGLNAVATFRRLGICEFMQLWGRGARLGKNKKKFMFYAPCYCLTSKSEESIDDYKSIIEEIHDYYKKIYNR